MFYQVFFLYYKGTKKFPHVQTFSEKNRKRPSHLHHLCNPLNTNTKQREGLPHTYRKSFTLTRPE